jgi:dihydroorotate dehydrogenase
VPSFSLFSRAGAAAYPLARRVLFRCDPEDAHHWTMSALELAQGTGLCGGLEPPGQAVECMGLRFPNAVGLAAGLDKDGVAIDAMGAMGFGFLEIGTLTPKPQPGNDLPRLFRLVPDEAIINRMGFNNRGIEDALPRARARRYRGILGINIGKNKLTPNENALDDYRACLRACRGVADYVAVNFSSPNTPGLRELQSAAALQALLGPLYAEARDPSLGKPVPVAVKIAPDLDDDQLASMARVFNQLKVDAVIATNTTIARDAVAGRPHAQETGGLSGKPVRAASTAIIRKLRGWLDKEIPIIGVGGIHSAADAREKIEAGASLIQLYTGFIYHGPALVRECVEALASPTGATAISSRS